MTPILLLGAGRMGGALIKGWMEAKAFSPCELIVHDPALTDPQVKAVMVGAQMTGQENFKAAQTVVLAVKPQVWREAAREQAPFLAPDAVIVSVAAGVRSADLAGAFGGRRIARVMPTTAAAICQGTASIYAADPEARRRAEDLFKPLGAVVHLGDEELMHAATAVSGSAPAYLYAFIEALEAAGLAAGLPKDAASRLARSTVTGAAALLAAGDEEPAELRRQVTSPGGTTAAALEVLMGEAGFEPLLRQAVAAAVRRSRELGA